MILRIVYDADGTCNKTIKGHFISAQLWDGGRAIIKVINKKGKTTNSYQYNKVYAMEKKH